MVAGSAKGRASAGDRRQALVEAAFDQIAEKGFEGLRLRDVAAAVGIDHSTLHHHFPTKGDLIAGVVDHATGQFRSTSADAEGPAEQIRLHLRSMVRLLGAWPALFIVLREVDLRATRDPAVRAIVDDREQGWRDSLTARLGQIRLTNGDRAARGASDELDPGATAELIIAAVKGASFNPAAAEAALGQLERLLDR